MDGAGAAVLNPFPVATLCRDKILTSQALAAGGVPAPETWVTQDRCDGTRTDVGKGRVTVLNRETRRSITVRSGRSYLVKAKLFAARRSRR